MTFVKKSKVRRVESTKNTIDNVYELLSSRLSLTRLGDFWKVLVTNLSSKIAQIFRNFLGLFKNGTLKQKDLQLLFGQVLENLGNFLI